MKEATEFILRNLAAKNKNNLNMNENIPKQSIVEKQ